MNSEVYIRVYERNRIKSATCFKIIKKKVAGKIHVQMLKLKAHYIIFLFLSVFEVFCNLFFLKMEN